MKNKVTQISVQVGEWRAHKTLGVKDNTYSGNLGLGREYFPREYLDRELTDYLDDTLNKIEKFLIEDDLRELKK